MLLRSSTGIAKICFQITQLFTYSKKHIPKDVLYLVTSGLKLKVNEVQFAGQGETQKLNSKPASFFRWGTDHIPAHTTPQPALFIKAAQLQVNKDNFSIRLYFKPKGQTLPSCDFTISGMHTYTSASNPLNRKQLRESHQTLLTNPEFYNLTLCYALGNTHQHLRVKTLALRQARTNIPRHFISSRWHIC